MHPISQHTEPTSRFNRLSVYEDGYAESHRVACVLYRIVTNIDVDLIGLACLLRNSFEDADAQAAELDGRAPEDALTLAALAITPHPNDADVTFNKKGVEKWHRAILTSSREERWLRLDPITLAPLINGEDQEFTSHMSTFLDWIRRFCSPSLLIAFENEIDWIGLKESTRQQATLDNSNPSRIAKSDFITDALDEAWNAISDHQARPLWRWIISNIKRWPEITYDPSNQALLNGKRTIDFEAFSARVGRKRKKNADV